MNAKLRNLLMTTAAAVLSLSALPGWVQAQPNVFRDAGAKIRGDAYWPARATSRYVVLLSNSL